MLVDGVVDFSDELCFSNESWKVNLDYRVTPMYNL